MELQEREMRDKLIAVETTVKNHLTQCSKENEAIWRKFDQMSAEFNQKVVHIDSSVDKVHARIDNMVKLSVLTMLGIIGNLVLIIWDITKNGSM